MAGVDEQKPPALGAVDGLLDGVPRHHGGRPHRAVGHRHVGRDEAVVRPVIDAVARQEHGHGVVRLRVAEHTQRVDDVGGGWRAVALAVVHQHAAHHFSCSAPSRCSMRIGEGDGIVAGEFQIAAWLRLL